VVLRKASSTYSLSYLRSGIFISRSFIYFIMTKTFFIIPGFKTQANDSQYQWLISYVKNRGWKIVKVPVVWNYNTLSTNAKNFIDFYNAHKTEENQILGFSYGAVITLLVASILSPDKIYLCSLSPDFKEDEKEMPKWLRTYIGIKRQKDVLTRSAIVLAKKLLVPTAIFYGELEGVEYPPLRRRSEDTFKYAKNSTLVVIPYSQHKIDSVEYMDALKKNLTL